MHGYLCRFPFPMHRASVLCQSGKMEENTACMWLSSVLMRACLLIHSKVPMLPDRHHGLHRAKIRLPMSFSLSLFLWKTGLLIIRSNLRNQGRDLGKERNSHILLHDLNSPWNPWHGQCMYVFICVRWCICTAYVCAFLWGAMGGCQVLQWHFNYILINEDYLNIWE